MAPSVSDTAPSAMTMAPVVDSTSIVPPMACRSPAAFCVILPVARIVMLPPNLALLPLAVTDAFSVMSPITLSSTLVPSAELIGTFTTTPPVLDATVTNTLPEWAVAVITCTSTSTRLSVAPIASPAVITRLWASRSTSGVNHVSSSGSPSMMLPVVATTLMSPLPASTVSNSTLRPALNCTLAP